MGNCEQQLTINTGYRFRTKTEMNLQYVTFIHKTLRNKNKKKSKASERKCNAWDDARTPQHGQAVDKLYNGTCTDVPIQLVYSKFATNGPKKGRVLPLTNVSPACLQHVYSLSM